MQKSIFNSKKIFKFTDVLVPEVNKLTSMNRIVISRRVRSTVINKKLSKASKFQPISHKGKQPETVWKKLARKNVCFIIYYVLFLFCLSALHIHKLLIDRRCLFSIHSIRIFSSRWNTNRTNCASTKVIFLFWNTKTPPIRHLDRKILIWSSSLANDSEAFTIATPLIKLHCFELITNSCNSGNIKKTTVLQCLPSFQCMLLDRFPCSAPRLGRLGILRLEDLDSGDFKIR